MLRMRFTTMLDDECWFCGSQVWLERHHIFGGPYRKASQKYGMLVNLCHWHHNEPPDGVHHNHENSLILKRWAQERFEKTHSRDEFRQVFGKSYLEGEET